MTPDEPLNFTRPPASAESRKTAKAALAECRAVLRLRRRDDPLEGCTPAYRAAAERAARERSTKGQT